jgi:hypothetical protein
MINVSKFPFENVKFGFQTVGTQEKFQQKLVQMSNVHLRQIILFIDLEAHDHDQTVYYDFS